MFKLRLFSASAIISTLSFLFTACIPDQSCSNPPPLRDNLLAEDAPETAGLTRANPIPLGVSTAYGDWEISANEMSQVADKVHVEVTATYNGEELSSDVGDLEFCLTGSSHQLYADMDSVSDDGPEPVLGEGYGDDQIRTGWVSFEAPSDESDLILAVRHSSTIFFADADFRYFGLERGVSVDPDLSSIADPTDVGASIDSPAPLGEAAVTSAFSLEIIESLTGEDAAEMMSDTSFLNPDPGEGNEFFLFKVRVRNVSDVSSPASISRFQFSTDGFREVHAVLLASSIYSSGGLGAGASALFSPFLELPGDELQATLYPGASFEGWVLLEVEVGTDPLVVYDPSIGGGLTHDPDRRYFHLEEVEEEDEQDEDDDEHEADDDNDEHEDDGDDDS